MLNNFLFSLHFFLPAPSHTSEKNKHLFYFFFLSVSDLMLLYHGILLPKATCACSLTPQILRLLEGKIFLDNLMTNTCICYCTLVPGYSTLLLEITQSRRKQMETPSLSLKGSGWDCSSLAYNTRGAEREPPRGT